MGRAAPARRDDSATAPAEAEVRALLPHTWHAFFARFGRLRPVQSAAVPRLVGGEDVLVVAPTASGKTEALMAPLLERHLNGSARPEPAGGLGVVLVSPTRALCNDLVRRLRGPVAATGLTLDLKTGDAPHLDTTRPPSLLVTTPESLDSLLCRHPALLRDLGAIALDEVHLLDGTARGDHVRCLLARLDRVVRGQLQRCGASATVPDVGGLARRYLGSAASWLSADELEAARRPILARSVRAPDFPTAAAAVATLFDEAPRRKLLVFANRRGDVEALAAELARRPRLAGRVFAHHGSLSRSERLRVERRFLDAPAAIAVATTTLELGLDIGDVDRVVLLGPPPDVGSLLQRVGRGNRREWATHALCLAQNGFEEARFGHLIACAEAGELFGEVVTLRPGVVAQQALSLLFQSPSGWISAEAMRDRLPEPERESWSEADCSSLLEDLAASGYVRRVQHGRYVADVEGENAFERGRVHSNVSDSAELEVVDELTGRALGTARFGRREREAAQAGAGLSLALAGRSHTVARVEERRVVVRGDAAGEQARFLAKEAPRYSFGLAQSLAAYLGHAPEVLVVERLGDDAWLVGHFLGSVWGRLLGGLLKRRGLKKGYGGGPFWVRASAPPEGRLFADEGSLRRELDEVLERDWKGLARRLGPGAFGGTVPRALTERWLRENVRPWELAAHLTRLKVVEGRLGDLSS